MNTLAATIGLCASIWICLWGFNTIEEDMIGYIGLGAIMFCLALVLWALAHDIDVAERFKSLRRGEDD